MTRRLVLDLRHRRPSRQPNATSPERRSRQMTSGRNGPDPTCDGDLGRVSQLSSSSPSDQQQGLHRQDVLRASALQRVRLAQEEAPEERRTSVSVAVFVTLVVAETQQRRTSVSGGTSRTRLWVPTFQPLGSYLLYDVLRGRC